uniref:Autophagy-related protein n=1 Tax=viral metagenome TaxID=1070528 RepID=A0A6C0KGD3_9ZZZZ
METETNYKNKHTLEKRKRESIKILNKYPNIIPIIITNKLDKQYRLENQNTKFLVPEYYTVGNLIFFFKKRVKMDVHESIFLLCENTMLCGSMSLTQLYAELKDEDGFLYITCAQESVFG